MQQLLGSSITYCIAVEPQQGRKVFTLQTLPACDEPSDERVRKGAEFMLSGRVAARADVRKKFERLCPCIFVRRTTIFGVRRAKAAFSPWVRDPPGNVAPAGRNWNGNYAA
jgi:hypothetical protein